MSAHEFTFERAVVLGSGAMGAKLAAMLAGAGLRVRLLDLASPGADRNAVARAGWRRALEAKPPALFLPEQARLVELGNFDDDLESLRSADWVIEAVAEELEIKRALLARSAPYLAPHAIFSTNTSGLSVAAICAALPAEARRRALGAHFFNPPRYLPLLELIPLPETGAEAVTALTGYAERQLGKGVLHAPDTPNFIANRVGAYSFLRAAEAAAELGLSVEDADALTGELLGWPKSATFRTADVVGLDVLAKVAENARRRLPREADRYRLPGYLEAMLSRGWLGEKTGQGFYRRLPAPAPPGGDAPPSQVLALDLETMVYRPRRRSELPALRRAEALPDIGERLRALLLEAPADDQARQFLWRSLGELWLYCAEILPELKVSPEILDRAMRWGFRWEWGPFELWDAAGFAATLAYWRGHARQLPHAVAELEKAGAAGWYAPATRQVFDAARGDYAPLALPRPRLETAPVMRRNAGCSLKDLGDGVACLEFHSKLNTIGPETAELITSVLHERPAPFRALVVGNEGAQFSAGANLLLLLLEMDEENWDDIALAVEGFQRMNLALKRSPVPVVAAPFGLTLGGGCELMLSAPRVVAHVELYCGLVELGVGLIPAGGGCKEMMRAARASTSAMKPPGALDAYEDALQSAFETIALSHVSSSAHEARKWGLLGDAGVIVPNRERLLEEARAEALRLAERGWSPRAPELIPAAGPDFRARLELGAYLLHQAARISDYDLHLARQLAGVIAGGGAPAGAALTEEAVLELEREAFLSLCGEARTRDRIAHMLKTGKALRN